MKSTDGVFFRPRRFGFVFGAVVFALAAISIKSFGADEEIDLNEIMKSDRVPASAVDELQRRAGQKQFPGGMDESDLQVQSTLPAPSRGTESVEVGASGSGAQTSQPPASD